MKNFSKKLLRVLNIFGFYPIETIMSIRGILPYIKDYFQLRGQQRFAGADSFKFGNFFPCLGDRYLSSGSARGHYFHQDLLVARKVFMAKPHLHIDVGSRVDGFVAHVASYREIIVIDIRPQSNHVTNIKFVQADLMSLLPSHLIETCDSLSCLHALEHFGLGRYGDPVSLEGYRYGFDNLYALLKPRGKLYFSVPIGELRIEFNAHRVFSLKHLLSMFSDRFQVVDFSFIDEAGDLHESIPLNDSMIKTNCGCIYGCGIFELLKL